MHVSNDSGRKSRQKKNGNARRPPGSNAAPCRAVAVVLGSGVGVLAGWFRGPVDTVLSWIVDLLLSLPRLVLLLAVMGVLRIVDTGSRVVVIALILGFTGWMGVARVVRGEILSLRERDWVTAARALGAGPGRIITRHLLPHVVGPIGVHATLLIGTTLLTEAALSFLGLGIPKDAASWGNMAFDGMQSLQAWWLSLFPGLTIVAAVLSANAAGDALREVLDPRGDER